MDLSHYEDRIRRSIKETQSLLNKELSYSKDLQKIDMIIFYEKHLEKLRNDLNTFPDCMNKIIKDLR